VRQPVEFEDRIYSFGALFVAVNRIDTLLERALEKFGVTSRQWFLSICVAHLFEKPPTLKELAKASGTSYQNVKQVALKLQEKKLMSVRKDPNDARVTRIALTPESEIFWAKTDPDSQRFIDRLYQGISAEDLRVTRATLDQLLANCDAMEERETV